MSSTCQFIFFREASSVAPVQFGSQTLLGLTMESARKTLQANTPDRKASAPFCRGTAHAGTIHDIFTNTNVKVNVVYEGFVYDGECCCCGSQVNPAGPVREAALGVVQDEGHGIDM